MPQTFNVGSRSVFVTLTAWAFLLLGTMASVSALLQNATLASWLPGLQGLGAAQPLPLLTGLLIGYLPWVMGAGLAVSLATMASAVGLLMRLEWARRCFIALLGLAITANLLGLWLQYELVRSVVDATLAHAPLPPAAANVFGNFVTASQVMAGVVTFAACALLAWIIRRLMSPSVRQEFA
ncbi:MAG: hypothetical protein V4792_15805 [Pseudomonadota bacterium]